MIASRALVPGSSSIALPQRWRSFRVSRQDADDYACGLHCIITAARCLRSIGGPASPRRILDALPPYHAVRIRQRLPAAGLSEKDIRCLADAADLAVYRPNTHEVSQFQKPGWLWMALVLVKFISPSGAESDDRHYVLVLDHLADKDLLVLADPHPWNPPVYCIALDDFESAWRVAKTKGPPWAAALYRRP